MHSEREVMSPPTKTVSVQIKLDLRRPGTFNYPKYHQRRCHDLTSARINGVLTKSLTRIVRRASRLPAWTRAADGFLHHCLGLNNCTCHEYDETALKKNRMKKKSWRKRFLCFRVCSWTGLCLMKWIKEEFHTMTKYFFSYLFYT